MKFKQTYLLLVILITTGCFTKNDEVINGYTDKTSYYSGEKCKIFINSESNVNAKLKLFDINGEVVDEISMVMFPQDTNGIAPWEKGFGYDLTVQYSVPNLPSGFYFIANKIPIVIKSKERKPITCVYPSNTINAYNNAGGKSLYSFNSSNKIGSNDVSFMRPMPFADSYGSKEFYQWISSLYDNKVNFICDRDLDSLNIYKDSKILLIPGHNEYWTRQAKVNFDRYINDGGHSVILSGNTMWWQTRYDTMANNMICYRDFNEDPITDIRYKTVCWTDKRLNYPIVKSIGANFDNGGYGRKEDDGFDGYKIVNPNSPILEETGLKFGDILHLPTTEFDGAPIQGFSTDSIPLLDTALLGFDRINLIGYDFGYRGKRTVGTFIVFQRHHNSGIVINCCSTEWCSKESMTGKHSRTIKKITTNITNKLLHNENVFN